MNHNTNPAHCDFCGDDADRRLVHIEFSGGIAAEIHEPGSKEPTYMDFGKCAHICDRCNVLLHDDHYSLLPIMIRAMVPRRPESVSEAKARRLLGAVLMPLIETVRTMVIARENASNN